MKVIILAGGLGTRLQCISDGLPKPMVPVEGRPFLCHLMDYAAKSGASEFILSICYKAEIIIDYIKNDFKGIPVRYSIEENPLGTGGAIRKAMEQSEMENAIIINGDTFFKISLKRLMNAHIESSSDISIALKPMEDFDRYGNITVRNGKVVAFEEKKHTAKGLINGGIYAVSRRIADFFPEENKFSFEKDFLEKKVSALKIKPFISNSYFIDIGIPEDYFRIRENSAIFNI